MHSITPEEQRYVSLIFGKFELSIPELSGISPKTKMLAKMKVGGEMSLIDVEVRSEVYALDCWSDKGRHRVVNVCEVYSFDTGLTVIDCDWLRVVDI